MEQDARRVVSLNDDDVVAKQANYFKGQQDQYYRVRIPDINSIMMYRQHFVENVGFMRCLEDKGEKCPVCEQIGEPVTRFKVNILVYNTSTQDGSLPDDLNYVSVSAQVFRFGIKMFSVLKAKHKKLAKKGGLGAVDLILHCTNGAYQHFDVEEQDPSETATTNDTRLNTIAEKLIKDQFIDFNTCPDRDLKFLTPIQQRDFMTKATGVAPKIETKGAADNEEANPALEEAERTLMGNDNESVGQNIDGLI